MASVAQKKKAPAAQQPLSVEGKAHTVYARTDQSYQLRTQKFRSPTLASRAISKLLLKRLVNLSLNLRNMGENVLLFGIHYFAYDGIPLGRCC